jgi:tRNA pseudouridine-54 N-methylase
MRTFILLANKARSTPGFDVNDMSGSLGGVCRTVFNALYTSRHARTDTVVKIVLNGPKDPPKLVTFTSDLGLLELSERGIAVALQEALNGKKVRGIMVERKSFEAEIKESANVYYLDRKGVEVNELKGEDLTFVLGDLFGFPPKTKKFLERCGKKTSLGRTMLQAYQCPIVIHYEIDRKQL